MAVVVGGCAIACAHGLRGEPALDFFDASLADAEQVLRWFLALGVRANLERVSQTAVNYRQLSSTLQNTDLCMFIVFGGPATHDQLHVLAASCHEHLLFDIRELCLQLVRHFRGT